MGIAHCLFEQSGTFKNEFRKLGIEAIDYDIQDEFHSTDRMVDLFAEIRGGYNGKPSIFDGIQADDLIMAFFPCTRFETKVQLWFRGENWAQRGWTDKQKLEKSLEMHGELCELYELLCKMTIICVDRGLRMVIENPWNQNYLTTYWCMKPAIIDKDRTQNGDYYKKPTQYWFINCKPRNNLVFEALDYVPQKHIESVKRQDNTTRKTERSMIHPQYANRFIRQYLLNENGEI